MRSIRVTIGALICVTGCGSTTTTPAPIAVIHWDDVNRTFPVDKPGTYTITWSGMSPLPGVGAVCKWELSPDNNAAPITQNSPSVNGTATQQSYLVAANWTVSADFVGNLSGHDCGNPTFTVIQPSN